MPGKDEFILIVLINRVLGSSQHLCVIDQRPRRPGLQFVYKDLQ